MIAGIAKFEREAMLERQREGVALAKVAGKYKGKERKYLPIILKNCGRSIWGGKCQR